MEGVITGKAAKPRRVILGGTKGIGKSTWAAGAPKPMFIQCEDGLDDIGPDRFPKCETFDEVLGRFQQLAEDEHQFKTAVLDSLDGLERLIFAQVCKDKNVESIEDIGYAKGYTFALNYWRQILACCDHLRNERGMHVVLIAHTKVDKFEDPENANYDFWNLQLHKHAAALITQWADEVFFATFKVHVTTKDEGFGREKTRAIGGSSRVIRATHRPSHVAKNRLDMPDEIPFPKKGGWTIYQLFIDAHAKGEVVDLSKLAPPPATAPATNGGAGAKKEPRSRTSRTAAAS